MIFFCFAFSCVCMALVTPVTKLSCAVVAVTPSSLFSSAAVAVSPKLVSAAAAVVAPVPPFATVMVGKSAIAWEWVAAA